MNMVWLYEFIRFSETTPLWLLAVLCLWAAVGGVICAHKSLHLLQLESYQIDGFDRSRKRQKNIGWDGRIAWVIVLLLVFTLFVALRQTIFSFCYPEPTQYYISPESTMPENIFWSLPLLAGLRSLFMIIAPPIALLITWLRNRKPAKKPLVYTKRVKRLMGVLLGVNFLLGIVSLGWIPGFGLLLLFQPQIVKLAAYIAAPIEKKINHGFFLDAQRKLDGRKDLIKIGITGSYGKTSTKFILASILGEKYNVLATPSSFNTPMGLTRVIREQLNDAHQVFIAEMGARHVGDIAELVELVHPTIGAISSIGPQHLETFFTIENISDTKYELIAGLPADGIAFFGDDGGLCTALYNRPRQGKKLLAGVGAGEGVRALDVQVGPEGSSFTLQTPDGKSMSMHTQLLGTHNIQNITLCCAIALELGLSLEQIAAGVQKAPPVEHRLQLIRGVGGNIVIDDAFNSNPAGAHAAMDVLSAFPGRRIVVTPGMVELGEKEDDYNRAFGKKMAESVDVAILIGPKHTAPIVEGLMENGFDRNNIVIVKTLDEAAVWLAANSRPGDVTLFENDLPDNYSE